MRKLAAPQQEAKAVLPHTAYQVDFVSVNCGRIVAASKRRIRFKFGYTNQEALTAGKTGQECRGSEHEVVITWSLSSGKQSIAFDLHEIFFDVGDSTQSKLSHSWKDEQHGHVLAVKIHAANMSTKSVPDPNWKQYDLIIDGVSFFDMPKIFEIGIFAKENTRGVHRGSGHSPQTHGGQARNFDYNRMGSLLPPHEPQNPEPPAEVVDLLSFDDLDEPAPVAAASPAQPSQAVTQAAMQSAPAQTSYALPQQAPVQTNFASQQAPVQTNYAPPQAPAQTNYYAQAQQNLPTPNMYANGQTQNQGNISIEASSNNLSTPSQDPTALYQNVTRPAMTQESNALGTSTAYAPQPTPVTPPSTSTSLVPTQHAPANYSVDGAVKNLVNMDDLFGTAAAPTVTKESFDAKTNEANAHKSLNQLQGSNTGVMNTFNAAPANQQQGMNNGFATQQQPQFNNYGIQQPYAQPGFNYQ